MGEKWAVTVTSTEYGVNFMKVRVRRRWVRAEFDTEAAAEAWAEELRQRRPYLTYRAVLLPREP